MEKTDKRIINGVTKVVFSLFRLDAYVATKYLSPTLIVRGTRKLSGRKIPAKNQNAEVILTIGKPNYRERDFIRDCKEAGESFPVRKIILKFPPKKKAKINVR